MDTLPDEVIISAIQTIEPSQETLLFLKTTLSQSIKQTNLKNLSQTKVVDIEKETGIIIAVPPETKRISDFKKEKHKTLCNFINMRPWLRVNGQNPYPDFVHIFELYMKAIVGSTITINPDGTLSIE